MEGVLVVGAGACLLVNGAGPWEVVGTVHQVLPLGEGGLAEGAGIVNTVGLPGEVVGLVVGAGIVSTVVPQVEVVVVAVVLLVQQSDEEEGGQSLV